MQGTCRAAYDAFRVGWIRVRVITTLLSYDVLGICLMQTFAAVCRLAAQDEAQMWLSRWRTRVKTSHGSHRFCSSWRAQSTAVTRRFGIPLVSTQRFSTHLF